MLFWGILGVIVLRAAMIALGATLVSQFSWVLYVFGAFLVLTGVKCGSWPTTRRTWPSTRCCAGCAATCG